MNKLLCIIGPTGTGKTKLAVSLSKKYNTPLVSADSRQVYKGMDIVTGKDHPKGVIILGLDLCTPDTPFSVSDWYDAVLPKLVSSPLSVVVGGTGLYIKTLLSPPSTLHTPVNAKLRNKLEKYEVEALIKKLEVLDAGRLSGMNNSDRHNKRRLIRAIEVAYYRDNSKSNPKSHPSFNSLVLGLTPPSDEVVYRTQIEKRVIARIKAGAVTETKQLLANFIPSLPAFSALGYQHLISYIRQELSEKELIELWTNDEYRYSKRQLLFFQTIPNVIWLDPLSGEFTSQLEKLLNNWYDGDKT